MYAELYEAGHQIYLIATEAHGKKSFKAFILPCFSVCFRGNNICLYQIEAVLEWQVNTGIGLLHDASEFTHDTHQGLIIVGLESQYQYRCCIR